MRTSGDRRRRISAILEERAGLFEIRESILGFFVGFDVGWQEDRLGFGLKEWLSPVALV